MLTMDTTLTADEHRAALERVNELMDAKAGTPEFEELKRLAKLVSEYEHIHYPIPEPDPAAVIEYALDSGRATLPDMIDIFGSRAALVDFITRKTPMDAEVAATISERYHYSVERLTAPFDGEQGWYDVLPGDEPWRQELKDAATADSIA